MRENRLYGSEGGGAGYPTGASYPYHGLFDRNTVVPADIPIFTELVTLGADGLFAPEAYHLVQ